MKSQNNYYVYLHKQLDGTIFYVGKGKDKRAYSKAYRNVDWKELVKQNGDYIVEIPYTNLSEDDAFEIEKKLISEIGIDKLCNKSTGGEGKSREPYKYQYILDRLIEVYYLMDISNNFDVYKKNKQIMKDIDTIVFCEQLKTEIDAIAN